MTDAPDIMAELAGFSKDPLGFVIFAFPWGEPGSEIATGTGPEPWQEAILTDLGAGVITLEGAIRLATTSGHGIGKSALVAWLILWAISTFEDTLGVVTANTETQLKTKTWAQLAKWHRLFIGRDYFKITATAIFSVDPLHEKTWRIDMVPWSERNTEAFAGLHNLGKRVVLIMDEASAIPDVIWETAEGALTDENTEIIWAVFGNPTRNKGRFRDCFEGGKFAHRWKSRAIDSRTISFTNKEQIAEWVKDYGEDSDFVRVRVRGIFPRIDSDSFISYELVMEATRRVPVLSSDPIIIGADIGRFGDDPSIIYPRKGRDAVTHEAEVIYKQDTMFTAGRIAAMFLRLRASMAFVDEGGVGGGVVDRLRQLRIPVIGVDFGASADGGDPNDGTKYANKRAEIIGKVRDWLKTGSIPERIRGLEISLPDEFTGPLYGMNSKEEIQLESKKDMRKRGVKSTNVLDALACTFAHDVYVPEPAGTREALPPVVTPDYNPFALEHLHVNA